MDDGGMVFLWIFLVGVIELPPGFQGKTEGTLVPTKVLQRFEPTQDFEAELGYVLDLSVAPNGDLAVLEGKSAYIYIWSASGQFKQRIGGPGKGPGELWDMHFLAFGRKYLYLYHFDGTITVYIKGEKGFANKQSKRFRIGNGFPRAFITLENDSLLIARCKGNDQNAPMKVERLDPKSGTVTELKDLAFKPKRPQHNIINMERFDIPLPLGMPRTWAARDGDHLLYGFSETNRLKQLDSTGKTVKALDINVPRYPGDNAARELWENTLIAVSDKTPRDIADRFDAKWQLIEDEPMAYYSQFAVVDEDHMLFFIEPLGGFQMSDYLSNGWAILYSLIQNKAMARGPIKIKEDARLFCAETGMYLAHYDNEDRILIDKVQFGWQ